MRIDGRTAKALGTVAAALVLALVWWGIGSTGDDSGPRTERSDHRSVAGSDPASGLPLVAEASLPEEARHTLALIDAGGPFPYPDHDGGVFGNYEGLLPAESRGYYREYTVKDPDEGDRGPWRIISGSSGELYWTPDHYASFQRIVRS